MHGKSDGHADLDNDERDGNCHPEHDRGDRVTELAQSAERNRKNSRGGSFGSAIASVDPRETPPLVFADGRSDGCGVVWRSRGVRWRRIGDNSAVESWYDPW
jgi:hypothetical protein